MLIKYNVRSTATNIPNVEVNVDTVYENFDVTRIIEDDELNSREEWNIGVQKIYGLREYIELISNEKDKMKQDNIVNMKAMVELHIKIMKLEGSL